MRCFGGCSAFCTKTQLMCVCKAHCMPSFETKVNNSHPCSGRDSCATCARLQKCGGAQPVETTPRTQRQPRQA